MRHVILTHMSDDMPDRVPDTDGKLFERAYDGLVIRAVSGVNHHEPRLS